MNIAKRLAALEATIRTPERCGPPDAEMLERAGLMLPAGSADEVYKLAERLQHPETLNDAELVAACDVIAHQHGFASWADFAKAGRLQ